MYVYVPFYILNIFIFIFMASLGRHSTCLWIFWDPHQLLHWQLFEKGRIHPFHSTPHLLVSPLPQNTCEPLCPALPYCQITGIAYRELLAHVMWLWHLHQWPGCV